MSEKSNQSNQSNQSKQIFDNWEQVDCNECSHYWDSSCDGVPQDSRKVCNSFLATRSVTIPAKIKSLEKDVKWLTKVCSILAITIVVCIITHLLLM